MLEFFKNIINSATDSATDRIKNPLVGAFIFAWIACNWNIVFIMLFSSKSIEEKIDYAIDGYDFYHGFGSPIILALIYIVFIPIITLIIDYSLRLITSLSLKNNHQKKIEILKLKKIEEQHKAEVDIAYEETKTGAEKEIQEIRESITESKKREGQLTQEAKELKEKIDSLNSELKIIKNQAELDVEELSSKIVILEAENSKLMGENNKFKPRVSIGRGVVTPYMGNVNK